MTQEQTTRNFKIMSRRHVMSAKLYYWELLFSISHTILLSAYFSGALKSKITSLKTPSFNLISAQTVAVCIILFKQTLRYISFYNHH